MMKLTRAVSQKLIIMQGVGPLHVWISELLWKEKVIWNVSRSLC